jgi:hypothetical protein
VWDAETAGSDGGSKVVTLAESIRAAKVLDAAASVKELYWAEAEFAADMYARSAVKGTKRTCGTSTKVHILTAQARSVRGKGTELRANAAETHARETHSQSRRVRVKGVTDLRVKAADKYA